MKEFYSIITNSGIEGIINAKITGEEVELLYLAVGDGGGAYYTPSSQQKKLVNEIYRTKINRMCQDPDYPTQMIIEAAIDETIGGFFIREVGIFDANDELFAIGRYPVTYKPVNESGSFKDLYIRMALRFSETPNIKLFLNPHSALVSTDQLKNFANKDLSNVDDEFKSHQNWLNLQGGKETERYHVTESQNETVENLDDLVKILNAGKSIVINSSGNGFEVKDLSSGLPIFSIFSSLLAETPPGAYPLWTGELIYNCKNIHPSFWEKAITSIQNGLLRSITDDEYNAEVELYDETGAFVINEGTGDLRLPKITRFLSSIDLLNQIGTAANDQIVNVTGKFPDSGNLNGAQGTGPFQVTGEACYSNSGGAWDGRYISFDLSRSIRTGDEVQPKHIKCPMFIQVYNSATPVNMMQASELINSLSNRADIQLSNVELAVLLSKLGLKGEENYISIPVKQSSGIVRNLLIQFGQISLNADNNAYVLFPTPFSESVKYANWMQMTGYSTTGSGTMTIYEVSKTGMRLGNGQDATGTAFWIVIGY